MDTKSPKLFFTRQIHPTPATSESRIWNGTLATDLRRGNGGNRICGTWPAGHIDLCYRLVSCGVVRNGWVARIRGSCHFHRRGALFFPGGLSRSVDNTARQNDVNGICFLGAACAASTKISLVPVAVVITLTALYGLQGAALRMKMSAWAAGVWLFVMGPLIIWTYHHTGSPFGVAFAPLFGQTAYPPVLQQALEDARRDNQTGLRNALYFMVLDLNGGSLSAHLLRSNHMLSPVEAAERAVVSSGTASCAHREVSSARLQVFGWAPIWFACRWGARLDPVVARPNSIQMGRRSFTCSSGTLARG